jgi:hypothetical protein
MSAKQRCVRDKETTNNKTKPGVIYVIYMYIQCLYICSKTLNQVKQVYKNRSTDSCIFKIYVITQNVGPEIWTPFLSLEEIVLPVVLVIVRIMLNMIVRHMPQNVR